MVLIDKLMEAFSNTTRWWLKQNDLEEYSTPRHFTGLRVNLHEALTRALADHAPQPTDKCPHCMSTDIRFQPIATIPGTGMALQCMNCKAWYPDGEPSPDLSKQLKSQPTGDVAGLINRVRNAGLERLANQLRQAVAELQRDRQPTGDVAELLNEVLEHAILDPSGSEHERKEAVLRQAFADLQDVIDSELLRNAELSADSRRLDYLEAMNKKYPYGAGVILRPSTTGRGWRLHSTQGWDWHPHKPAETVRAAIDAAMETDDAS